MSWFEAYPHWTLVWGGVGFALLLLAWHFRSRNNLAYERLLVWLLPLGWCHLGFSIPLFKAGVALPEGLSGYYTAMAILLTLEMLPVFLGTFTAIAVVKKAHDAEFQSLFLGARAHLESGLLPLWVLIQAGFIGIYCLA